jgi:hypothetical protein
MIFMNNEQKKTNYTRATIEKLLKVRVKKNRTSDEYCFDKHN